MVNFASLSLKICFLRKFMSEQKPHSKLSQRDMAGILRIDTKTLYNWRKNKPELYTIVLLGFKFKELLECQKRLTQELESIDEGLSGKIRL